MQSGSGQRNCRSVCKRSCPTARTRVRVPWGLLLDQTTKFFFYVQTGPPSLFMFKLDLQVFLCSDWASKYFYAQTGPPGLFMLKLDLQVFLCSYWASKSFYAQTGPPGLFMLKLGLQVVFMLRHHCPVVGILFLLPSSSFSGNRSPLLFIMLPLVSSLRSTLETFVFSQTNVSRVRAWWGERGCYC